jgi:hypothetical protein
MSNRRLFLSASPPTLAALPPAPAARRSPKLLAPLSLLLVISALAHFKPSEPFLTPYLQLYHDLPIIGTSMYVDPSPTQPDPAQT